MNKPPLFNFAWFRDFNEAIESLAKLAMPENWNYRNLPSATQDHPILRNYLHHIFTKINEDNRIEFYGDFCCFDTGLVTANQEEIFSLFVKNKKPNTTISWFFKGFKKRSDRDLMQFSKLPDPVNFFDDPRDLLYDLNLELRLNIDHIIVDNKTRFPAPFNDMDNYQLTILMQGAIEDSKKRIRRNYKTAIPQFYKGKIQLLIPLCLKSKGQADLALVIEKENNIYRAATCLTLDMAYNNARLITKPDDEWLKP